MKAAGKPVTRGQYGRLAGSMPSYIAPALVAGSAGNVAGNLLDQDV